MFRTLVNALLLLVPCSTTDASCSEGICDILLLQTGGGKLVPDNSVNMQFLKESGQLHLGIKHMSKTGGSHMISLANSMAVTLEKPQTVAYAPVYISEMMALTPERKTNTFMISAVRNPCDWYVSLYAFESLWTDPSFYSGEFFDGSTENANKTKFAEWLRWALGGRGNDPVPRDALGVMSLRYWDTLISQKDLETEFYSGHTLDQYVKNNTAQSKKDAIRSWNPSSLVDCWVYDETYNADLESCLRKYEMLSGAKLDWTPFKVAQFADVKANPSIHQSCSYYYSPELTDLVMTHERYMFEKFGYSTCCSDSR